MSLKEHNSDPAQGSAHEFRTTHWSVVLAAGRDSSPDARAALETLCRAYWRPLRAFVQRQGHDPEAARDLTQEFFARLLERNPFAALDPDAGRFRSWLLTALKRFLINEWHHDRAGKRGGGQVIVPLDAFESDESWPVEIAHRATPEMAYEHAWANALLERVMDRLEAAYAGHPVGFRQLEPFLAGDKGATRFAPAATRLRVTEAALKSQVFRLRRRFREIFREEVAQTVGSLAEVEDEMRHIITVLSQ